jgi:hypothetical protein
MKEKHLSDAKRFLLTLLATTFSIILTFGTSAIIERRHKAAAKKEMVMMIIYDFDKTLEQAQYADSVLQQAGVAEMEIAQHPEYYDSLRPQIMSAVGVTQTEFSETTEKIFSSNIETFNTLGNVNFVHEVSAFYHNRRMYKQLVFDELLTLIQNSRIMFSVENLLEVSFPMYSLYSWQGLVAMRAVRNRCVQMMNVNEKELEKFSQRRTVTEDISKEDSIILEQRIQDMLEFSRMNR